VRHAEAGGDRRAAALVAIEQLQHAGGRAQGGDALERLGVVDRVDQPDALLGRERVRGAHELRVDPGERERQLVVVEGHPRHRRRRSARRPDGRRAR
jgi:hypothetical protein